LKLIRAGYALNMSIIMHSKDVAKNINIFMDKKKGNQYQNGAPCWMRRQNVQIVTFVE